MNFALFIELTGPPKLLTKQGCALRFVLGMTEEVLRFDKARKSLKTSPNTKTMKEAYLHISAVMETRISQAQTSSKQQMKEIEKEFFKNNGKLPTSQTLLKDPTVNSLTNKLKYCKALEQQWREENKN